VAAATSLTTRRQHGVIGGSTMVGNTAVAAAQTINNQLKVLNSHASFVEDVKDTFQL
jgi:hypothetical protein